MGAALVLLLVGLGAMAAGVLIGRYYVPDDRQLRRTARHSRAYMRALSHLLAREHDSVVSELRSVVEENVEDVEPYFALGAVFRSRGEHERAIRVHQALALRERERRKLRQRAMYELGLDFRAAGMPRRATRAMEEVLLEEPGHEGALRALAALYEEQTRFNEAADLWQRLGRRRGEGTGRREHHLLVAAAQSALGRDDLDSARQLLKAAQKLEESAHFFAAAAELAAARNHHQDAKDRLKQALIADPGLAPHLVPGLVAAEEGLDAEEPGNRRRVRDEFDDLELEAPPPPARLASGSGLALPAPGSVSTATASGTPAATDGGAGGASRSTVLGIPTSSAGAMAGGASSTGPGMHASTAGAMTGAIASTSSGRSGSTEGAMASTVSPQASDAGASTAGAMAGAASPPASDGGASTAGAMAGNASSTASSVSPSTEGAMTTAASPAAGGTSATGPGAHAPEHGVSAPAHRGRTLAGMAALPALVTPAVSIAPASEARGPSPSRERAGVSVSGIEAKDAPAASIAERVLAVLAEVEAQTGPRLELALIRAQLTPATTAARAELASELMARFPDALAARVAAARLALANDEPRAIRDALEGMASDSGAVAWALRGRWQCTHCGHRPGAFSWRCGQCRRWDTLRMETGVEPPPVAPRERRAAPRAGRVEGLLGASPAEALPIATLDPGLSDDELASGGTRHSLLGRVGGWVSGLWRRGAS